jgi:hypothetical protein
MYTAYVTAVTVLPVTSTEYCPRTRWLLLLALQSKVDINGGMGFSSLLVMEYLMLFQYKTYICPLA